MRPGVIALAVVAFFGANTSSTRGAVPRQAGERDCVLVQSSGRLGAGTPYQADLPLGLEFRLSAEWRVSVGPKDEHGMDYLWLVSPPLQTAPHRIIGPAYGMTARDSVNIERPLRFVLTKTDHAAAIEAIGLQADATLRRLNELGRGRLSLRITDHRIRDIVLPDGRPGDAFEWITFVGEACVPRRQ